MRERIRREQLAVAAQLQALKATNIKPYLGEDQQVGTMPGSMDETMLTPYGPPSPDAYIVNVPDDIVGLIIGKGGETIRTLQIESGARV
jgi:hypothetical protein